MGIEHYPLPVLKKGMRIVYNPGPFYGKEWV